MQSRRPWRALIALALAGLAMTSALAQTQYATPNGPAANGAVVMCLNSSGQAVPVSGGQCANVAPAARNFPGCTVGMSSAQCLAAGTAQQFVQIQNTSASANVACRWGGAAALNSNQSVQLGPGQSASWGPSTAGVPSGQLNCIASAASTPLYVEWQ